METFTKYRMMEILEKVHLLGLAHKVLPYMEIANPYLIAANIPYWWKEAPDGLPIPPLRLIYRVTGFANIPWFLHSGELSVQSMVYILGKYRFAFNDFRAILDFGCGCGRIIRHLKSLTRAELYATDYDRISIDWCKSYLDIAHFAANQTAPPLEYADGHFDFVYAISVFTHLPEVLQLVWMKELSRVLKHGGLLMITTHGKHYLRRLAKEEREQFLLGNLIVKRTEYAGTNLCTAFHPEQYVRNSLMKDFEVLDFIPEGMRGTPHQDIYLIKNLK